MSTRLDTAITELSGVGKTRAAKYERLGVKTVGDLIRFTPRAYERRSDVLPLCAADLNSPRGYLLTVGGRVSSTRIRAGLTISKFKAFDESGVPMLYVFSTCKHFIRTLPSLVYDESRVEDINSDGEDHIYDELRYVCMENPISRGAQMPAQKPAYSPLSDDIRYEPYGWYKNY